MIRAFENWVEPSSNDVLFWAWVTAILIIDSMIFPLLGVLLIPYFVLYFCGAAWDAFNFGMRSDVEVG